jgi:hypothetical protein
MILLKSFYCSKHKQWHRSTEPEFEPCLKARNCPDIIVKIDERPFKDFYDYYDKLAMKRGCN